MNKNDLIVAVATTAGISKSDAAKALDATFDIIGRTLKRKERVMIVGFGSFSPARRKGGEGRDPRTGEKIKIGPSNQVKFKAGKGLKDTLNG